MKSSWSPSCSIHIHQPVRKSIMPPIKLVMAAATLLILGLLSGCGNNPYAANDNDKSILYLALAEDPKTMDPSIAYDVPSASVIDVIYPAFLQYHYLKRDPFVLEPALGESEPTRENFPVVVEDNGKKINKTGERWTFHIKHGLLYQDDPCFAGGKGREITGADFLFCFRRMGDPKVDCPIVTFFNEKILGYTEFQSHLKSLASPGVSDYNAPVEGLQFDAADPYTFRIVLNQPYPQLRYLMAMHFTSPLAHEAVAAYGKKLARHPVGCGAFVMTEYSPRSRIVLSVNPNRRKEFYPAEGAPGDRELGLLSDAGKLLPLVQKVQFNIVRESITSWNTFLQGYQDTSVVTQQNYQQVLGTAGNSTLSGDMKKRGIRLHLAVAVDCWYFVFNWEDPTFGGGSEKNRKLRKAISLALDQRTELDLLRQGLGKPAQSLIPPGLYGYDPNYKNPYRQTDPGMTKAKQLLAEAGYPDGIDPKTGKRLEMSWLNSHNDPLGRQMIGLVTKELEDGLGIRVKSETLRFPIFQAKVDKGEFQFIDWGWVADYPDPENFDFLLYGPNKRPGPNHAAYSNPEYDRIFEQMQVMDNSPQRKELIIKMRDIAERDLPIIPRYHEEVYALAQPWVTNYKTHPVSLDLHKYRGVNVALRSRLRDEWNHPVFWPIPVVVLLLFLGTLPALNVVKARTERKVRRHKGENS